MTGLSSLSARALASVLHTEDMKQLKTKMNPGNMVLPGFESFSKQYFVCLPTAQRMKRRDLKIRDLPFLT